MVSVKFDDSLCSISYILSCRKDKLSRFAGISSSSQHESAFSLVFLNVWGDCLKGRTGRRWFAMLSRTHVAVCSFGFNLLCQYSRGRSWNINTFASLTVTCLYDYHIWSLCILVVCNKGSVHLDTVAGYAKSFLLGRETVDPSAVMIDMIGEHHLKPKPPPEVLPLSSGNKDLVSERKSIFSHCMWSQPGERGPL